MDKEKEILNRQLQLARRVNGMQNDLYALILEDYLNEFILEDGNLMWSTENISLIRDVDDLLDSLQVEALMAWLAAEMMALSEVSFKDFLDRGLKPTMPFDMIQRQIGMAGDNFIVGGYLDSLSRQEQAKLTLKNYVMQSIGEGKPYRQFQYGFRQLIKGEDGILQKYYDTYARDVFAQVVRITDLQIANDLGLTHFVYSGGLIDTSRQFCIKKDGKVFSRKDAEAWRNDPDLPGRDSSFAYNPLVDCGRWNCRHTLEWITDEEYNNYKDHDETGSASGGGQLSEAD